jgi:dTDP-4-dehydrorhamnose reductase
MRILLTGSSGQLGSEFRALDRSTAEVISTGCKELDLTDEQEIRRFVRDAKPSVIINTAAFTDMDAAERNWDACFALNAMAPVVLAEEAHRLDALLIHYSTDQVFAGTKTEPYVETDHAAPLNVYGASKLAGEEGIASSFARAIVLRLGWTYSARGENFLRSILRLARFSNELHVTADQIGAPTSTRSVAQATHRLVRMYADARKARFPSGIYHLTAGGATTWHGFAQAVLSMAPGSRKPVVTPAATTEDPSFALRPRYCVLSCRKFLATFGFQLPPWEEQLKDVMQEVRELHASSEVKATQHLIGCD